MTFGLLGTLTGLVATHCALGQTASLLTTFTNPAPAANDYFGGVLASVGSDRVLIGAYSDNTGAMEAGAAYLFSTNGALLTTFTNPLPAAGDNFALAVAAVGSARVLVGAPYDDTGATDAGAAYLFNTNGAWLATFPNPTPGVGDQFGISVAGLGSDRVLVGADYGDTGATDAGAAYLFGINGTLLTTFTNPTPANSDGFGISVAAVGSDRVLIGAWLDDAGAADAGVAYLFSTNGTLLTTFTNPTPSSSDYFGFSLSAVGSDRVLIGADADDTAAVNAGAAYLFSTNGALLNTFINPSPAFGDSFGISVGALGMDRVLIGAYFEDTGAPDAGAAYLFSTNGTLLNTFTNPTPAVADFFGYPVAGVGSDHVLVGTQLDDTGASDAGAAYLFSLPPPAAPSLSISLTTTNTVAVSWPSPSTGFTLQQNTNGIATVNWSNVMDTIADNGTTRTLIVNPPAGNRFYRLFKP